MTATPSRRRARGGELPRRGPDQRGYGRSDAPEAVEPGCGHWTQQERPAEVSTH
ncbi:hypothetical protein [Pseudonocardia sp. T1-2H]|uniref:hypothetical protein n=1 Tax=Pseudonocardia sp. T1-2H TaxID=3128899 RepID=UPI0031010B73